MRLILLLMMVATFTLSLQAEEGKCFPNEYTSEHQVRFCYLTPKSNCEIMGCEWRIKKHRCQANEYTSEHQVRFCYLTPKSNCEIMGCEWASYYY